MSFHVGSQQTDPGAWRTGIEHAANVGRRLAAYGVELDMLNLGGGFPDRLQRIRAAAGRLRRGDRQAASRTFRHTPRRPLMLEPGRAVVADAGVLRSEVVLVSRKSAYDEHRWVYLDVGRYGGLAETEGEAITYRLATRPTATDRRPGRSCWPGRRATATT